MPVKSRSSIRPPTTADLVDPEFARSEQAVMAAYGWEDVPLEHGFHTYRQMERWTVSPAARVEIPDRLLAENLRRAAAQPTTGKAKPGARAASRDRRDAGDVAVTDPAPRVSQ